jgi:rhamnogalacturonyl hydrolase YesR
MNVRMSITVSPTDFTPSTRSLVPAFRTAVALSFCCARLHSQPVLPIGDPAATLSVMERVADWQLANPSRHPATDWTQGAGDAGFMALAGISGNPRYREAMLEAGQKTQWQPGPRIYHADDYCVGQTYDELYMLYRDPGMITPLRARFDGILANPSAVTSLDFGQPNNRATENWSWCDSLFMGPPAWVRLYYATGDARYLDFAVRNWWRTTDFLYDRDEHLFSRDSSYFQKREANGRKVFWSRGNGWVVAGLVRVLQYLPANHPDRGRFERLFTDMSVKILSCQQPDGLWRASLLDPGSYPLREASGSGFFAYALAWGVNEGLLDRATFEPAVMKAWAALVGCVGPDGRLGHVQPIGADPKAFPEDSTEVYGVGAFLLAGSEVYRLPILEGMTPAPVGINGAWRPRPGRVVISVTNPSAILRHQETVELDPGSFGTTGDLAVMDSLSSRIVASQLYASQPGQPPDKLLFQVDLAPFETRRFLVLGSGCGVAAAPRPVVMTYARRVPERYDDVAWESDRIAHRMYQEALATGEGTVSSGIDVWAKRTRALVVDEWYRRKNYHEDDGDGLDDYQVGRSRGCGGLGVWSGGKLYVSGNYHEGRIITSGPIRSEFELNYPPWKAGGRMVSEQKRISIDAGSNFSRAVSSFSTGDLSPIEIGIGIAQRAGAVGSATKDPQGEWMAYWQPPDRDRGSIGCAVILQFGTFRGFALEDASVPPVAPEKRLVPGIEGLPPVGNQLLIAQLNAPLPGVVYYFGAGWSRSGDFPDEASWVDYVRRYAAGIRQPLTVGISKSPP